MDAPGGHRPSGGARATGRGRFILVPAAAACLGLGGCASSLWDEVSSREFSVKTYFEARPDPLVVLRDSHDGDKRAKALRALREPNQSGGSEEEQNVVVDILTTAASSESQPLCRLAAIQSLRSFKDARAVKGLEDAYYHAGRFPPDTATVIRCQALEALGETGNPAAVETLARVLQEPPVDGAEADRQQSLDVRVAAARALGHFKQFQATEALWKVLQGELDVALRDRAAESLQLATGRDFGPDAKKWGDFLHNTGGADAVADMPKAKLFGVVPVNW